jgi:hypothetical protein
VGGPVTGPSPQRAADAAEGALALLCSLNDDLLSLGHCLDTVAAWARARVDPILDPDGDDVGLRLHTMACAIESLLSTTRYELLEVASRLRAAVSALRAAVGAVRIGRASTATATSTTATQ